MFKIILTPEQIERLRTEDFRKGFIVNNRAKNNMSYGYVVKYTRRHKNNFYFVIPLKKISDGEFKVMADKTKMIKYWKASACVIIARPVGNPGSEEYSTIIIYDQNDTVMAVCEINNTCVSHNIMPLATRQED